jgi:hypothetical protein
VKSQKRKKKWKAPKKWSLSLIGTERREAMIRKITSLLILLAAVALHAQTPVTAPSGPLASAHYAPNPYMVVPSDSVILMSGGLICLPSMTAPQTVFVFNTNVSANLVVSASGGDADLYTIPPGTGVAITNRGKDAGQDWWIGLD